MWKDSHIRTETEHDTSELAENERELDRNIRGNSGGGRIAV